VPFASAQGIKNLLISCENFPKVISAPFWNSNTNFHSSFLPFHCATPTFTYVMFTASLALWDNQDRIQTPGSMVTHRR